ncbi:MAG TPA: excinuclease ABC subunit UvrA [Pirellulaceae bacterium]|nr:excinuclease ABC subunit UvrA [Pirellulaceae bacterium]
MAAHRSSPTDSPSAVSDGPDGDAIRIRGARTHNLKNVDLDIPRGKLVVITGKSGSGKSSLAFDTLFAEGQRQYIESLSVQARQFFDQLKRPDVDAIEGLAPVICIDQRPGHARERSTVATTTEIYDYLRLLFARLGNVFCPSCGTQVRQQSLTQIEETLAALPEGTKLMLLAPIVRDQRGDQAEAIAGVRKSGLVRVRIDGQVHEFDQAPPLDARQSHTIEAVVDRIVIRKGAGGRLAESLALTAKHGGGVIIACFLSPDQAKTNGNRDGQWTERLFSTVYACPRCRTSLMELEPRTFSFNSPYGACPHCQGLGVRDEFDPELVLPDLAKSVAGGAIALRLTAASTRRDSGLSDVERGREGEGETDAPVAKRRSKKTDLATGHLAAIASFLAAHDADVETPLDQLPPDVFEKLLCGESQSQFPGLLTLLEKEYATATESGRKEQLEAFRSQVTCAACGGARLRPEALAVRIGGKNIHEVTRLAVDQAGEFFQSLRWSGDDEPVADPILHEIAGRLQFLQKVGLSYLTLQRPADTLSGGERQRVRLATGIGSGLTGILYILDEPSIGLHPRDNDRLIGALRELQEQGNTILVVEHDEAMMRQADWLIDIGPGAGVHGGEVLSQGTPQEVAADPQSITGGYLSGRLQIEVPQARRRVAKTRAIVLEGATLHNLQNVSVTIPLGVFVAVTGVSGSGKSSLILETLTRAVCKTAISGRGYTGQAPRPGPYTSLRGSSQIDKLIEIDQSQLGRSPRSSAATYTGLFDEIRKVFAATKEARQLGFKANRFSFNVAGGRCDECLGHGQKKIEMNFLPDLYVTCPVCHGARFNHQTLAVKYRQRTIADVLAMPVDESLEFFANIESIRRVLESLRDVGLGYLPLGQPSTTLSGGEAQRVKLATELSRTDTGQTFYVLDEPTTGLHFDDIRLLLGVLHRLVDRGNTVLVIEHNLDVIKTADWIIDLGPEGGAAGGQIVAAGTPEEVAAAPASPTGRFLKQVLA